MRTAGARGVLLLLAATMAVTISSAQEADGVADTKRAATVHDKGRFFVGRYQTTTHTVVVASTSTVFFSCLSGTTDHVCSIRRRRTVSIPIEKDAPGSEGDSSLVLDSSSGGDEDLATDRTLTDDDPSEKSAFIVWTTTKTTTSVTVFYTNTASTIRLSYLCKVAGVSLPSVHCGGV